MAQLLVLVQWIKQYVGRVLGIRLQSMSDFDTDSLMCGSYEPRLFFSHIGNKESLLWGLLACILFYLSSLDGPWIDPS